MATYKADGTLVATFVPKAKAHQPPKIYYAIKGEPVKKGPGLIATPHLYEWPIIAWAVFDGITKPLTREFIVKTEAPGLTYQELQAIVKCAKDALNMPPFPFVGLPLSYALKNWLTK